MRFAFFTVESDWLLAAGGAGLAATAESTQAVILDSCVVGWSARSTVSAATTRAGPA